MLTSTPTITPQLDLHTEVKALARACPDHFHHTIHWTLRTLGECPTQGEIDATLVELPDTAWVLTFLCSYWKEPITTRICTVIVTPHTPEAFDYLHAIEEPEAVILI